MIAASDRVRHISSAAKSTLKSARGGMAENPMRYVRGAAVGATIDPQPPRAGSRARVSAASAARRMDEACLMRGFSAGPSRRLTGTMAGDGGWEQLGLTPSLAERQHG